jgi:hypothetical protein
MRSGEKGAQMKRNVGPPLNYVAIGDQVFPAGPARILESDFAPLIEGDRVRFRDHALRFYRPDTRARIASMRGIVRSISGTNVTVVWNESERKNYLQKSQLVRATD